MSDGDGGRALKNGATNGKAKRRQFPGEEILLRMIAEADYELNVDPYRGMLRPTDAPAWSPWESTCRWDAPNNENTDTSAASSLVQMTCQNKCPCMISWTEQAQKKKNKGKKANQGTRLGKRPANSERCRCDYNPFCLTSLGGAMDQVWQRRLQSTLGGEESSDEVVVIEADGSEAGSSELPKLSLDPSADLDKTIYRQRTWADLRALRGSQLVERAQIETYLKNTLQDLTSVVSVETCLERIEAWHQKLLFSNPLKDSPLPEGQIRLALPPGIENLGATCYLNTQLQCLAQINVFLEGIFSWRSPEKNDKVHEVLALFQRIMADLYAGSKSTTTTVEFSNALGIDHFEQQDPNEFSRLFFDMMHNAFQKEGSSDGPSGLPELLPDLFQGTIQNSIICQKCTNHSDRKEAFMDLNLPISAEEEQRTQRTGKQSILEMLSIQTQPQLDVQLLFDQYCRDEVLEGDNQYYCEHCGSKQNAIRRVKFTKVPPLLNIQLSRYIFDMKTFAKKKVSDKVLLPRQITVQADTEDPSNPGKRAYLLCAVMIHRGKSAYSGHYVAQAMDWTTGYWFDFNDTHVKLLKDGPESSFDPSKNSGRAPRGVTGSGDAYNLYYVEESFLAQSIVDRFRNFAQNQELSSLILQEKAKERVEYYTKLKDACFNDQDAAARLMRRRDYILDELFRLDRPLEVLPQNGDDPPPVWVPGSFCRRYFGCSDTFEDELKQDTVDDLISASDNLCQHGQKGLPPRVARRGKLLPRVVYETIVSMLREERKSLLKDSNMKIDECEDGFVISPSENMRCQDCVVEYQANLRRKYDLLQDYVFLFKELLLMATDEPLEYEQGTIFEADEDRYVYLVSKKFCNSLRQHIKGLMKLVAHSDGESFAVDEKLLPRYENVAEGIDTFELKDIEVPHTGDFDIFVNQNITCPHGQVKRYQKNQVRFVSWKLWNRIQKLFPQAIEHKLAKRNADEVEMVEVDEEKCALCESHSTRADILCSYLSTLAQKFSSTAICRPPDQDDVLLADTTKESFYAVHTEDGLAIRRFCRTFKNVSSKAGVDDIRREVLQCFQKAAADLDVNKSRDFSTLDETDRRILQLTEKLVFPLKCKAHGHAVERIVITSSAGPGSVLSPKVQLVTGSDFREYILSLCALARVLVLSEISLEFENLDENEVLDYAYLEELCLKHGVLEWNPIAKSGIAPPSDSRTFVLSGSTISMRLLWNDKLCHCQECCLAFDRLSSNLKQTANGKTSSSSGTKADDPILIDLEETSSETFPLTVFEAEASASDEKILEGLLECMGVSCGTETDKPSQGVRRSSRRRKTRIPMGALTFEETIQADICHNIAALRLYLMESLKEGKEFSLDHRLLLVVTPVDTKAEPTDQSFGTANSKMVKLDFGKNSLTLLDIAEKALNGDLSSLVPKDSLVLVRQAVVEEYADGFEKDSLMDVLIGQSNAASQDPNEKKRRSRAIERGFTGTLLSSSSVQSTSLTENGKYADKNETKVDTNDTTAACRAIVQLKNATNGGASPTLKANTPRKVEEPTSKRRRIDVDPDEEAHLYEATEDTTMGAEKHLGINLVDEDDSYRFVATVHDELKSLLSDPTSNPTYLFEASEWAAKQPFLSQRSLQEVVDRACTKYYDLLFNGEK